MSVDQGEQGDAWPRRGRIAEDEAIVRLDLKEILRRRRLRGGGRDAAAATRR